MNHSCHFCNRCFDTNISRILHESKCGYTCLLHNPLSLEQNPPSISTIVRVMQYMASQLNELKPDRNANENKKQTSTLKSTKESSIKPLRVLQNSTHPSETLSSFFNTYVLSYISRNINVVFEKGLCEGMKAILQEALTDYKDVLPIQSHIVKMSSYYGYVFSEENKLYEWKKLAINDLNELFKSLETEIIHYFDTEWKQENIQVLDNLDKFYHYVGQVTGEKDGSENARNKQLRTVIEDFAAIKYKQPINETEE